MFTKHGINWQSQCSHLACHGVGVGTAARND